MHRGSLHPCGKSHEDLTARFWGIGGQILELRPPLKIFGGKIGEGSGGHP